MPYGAYGEAIEHAAYGDPVSSVAEDVLWSVADVEPTGAIGGGMLGASLVGSGAKQAYIPLHEEAQMWESLGMHDKAMETEMKALGAGVQGAVEPIKRAGEYIGDVGSQFWGEYFE
jgi:hypothetical protein